MASAKRIPPAKVERDTRDVQLTITEYEARVLLAVCRRIGGPPIGPRGQMDNVNEALTLAGVEVSSNEFHISNTSASIHFE